MLETFRSFGEHPRQGRHVQLSRQSALSHRAMSEGHPALGEDRLLHEIEPVGKLELLGDGSATDPRPDFAENRTLGGKEGLEVECAVERRKSIFQYGPCQFENRLSLLACRGKHD